MTQEISYQARIIVRLPDDVEPPTLTTIEFVVAQAVDAELPKDQIVEVTVRAERLDR